MSDIVQQKPMEHIKSDNVDIDTGGDSINWDEMSVFWEKFMSMSNEERNKYLQTTRSMNDRLMEESAARVRESKRRGVLFRHTAHPKDR